MILRKRLIPLPGLALMLIACAAGPDYHRPATHVSDHFARKVDTEAQAPGASAAAPLDADIAFWNGFGDATLSRLVQQALNANLDLKAALSRYDNANALLSTAKFDRYPTVTASGQVGHQLLSEDEAFGAPRNERDTPITSLTANATWELDLWGRVRREVEAQKAEVRASAADVRAARLTIAADVAQTYINLRGNQARLAIARDNAENQRETNDLIEARVRAGRGSDFDTARARAQVESTTSRISAYEAIIGVDEHRLAVLIGQPPDSLIAELNIEAPPPTLSAAIDSGTPGDLLRRRPDIAAAEERLHEATARVGVATADLFPKFSLTGMLGSLTNSYGFVRSESQTNLIALGIDWSFLDVGRVRARIAQSNAAAAGQLASYQQAVLLAIEDAEDALLQTSRTREETAELDKAASDSALAAKLAETRLSAGAIDLYEVLDAERTKLQAQDAAMEAAIRRDTAAIALYRALAGGWPNGTVYQARE
jgi:NodT family efflux transporter outer membrane factor (OMF) lipoprotein